MNHTQFLYAYFLEQLAFIGLIHSLNQESEISR